jgi:hypothetical protein
MANGTADYKNVTEDRLLRIAGDLHDAIMVMSQYPECFQAYKDLIHKKRSIKLMSTDHLGGGLTASNSQQEECLIGIRSTPK